MNLLPLSENPFVAPTDRDMLPSERREFVLTHRTCFAFLKQVIEPIDFHHFKVFFSGSTVRTIPIIWDVFPGCTWGNTFVRIS